MSRGVIFIVASDKRLAGGHCDEEKTRKLEGGKFADMSQPIRKICFTDVLTIIRVEE